MQLVEEISQEDSQKRRAYYIARYGADGRLDTIEKMLDGQRFFLHEYSYYPDGRLAKAKVTNKDGTTSVHQYDQRGNLGSAGRP